MKDVVNVQNDGLAFSIYYHNLEYYNEAYLIITFKQELFSAN